MSGPVIEAAICLDRNLLLPAAVLIRSIREHMDPEHRLRLHVLTTFDVADLHALVDEDHDGFKMAAAQVADPFGRFPRNDYISQGTYLRFLLPDHLPSVPRLIYLDVDMIVRRDLAALFAMDLEGLGLAAASDASLLEGSAFWDRFEVDYDGRVTSFAEYIETAVALPNTGGDDYLNAGLLVIDLDNWRHHDIAARTLAFLAERPGLRFMDQDALSYVMQGRFVRLDTRWNAMANCAGAPDRRLKTRLSSAGRRWERVRTAWRTDPWIIHYAGANKPWNAQAPVAHGDIWWSYARRSKAWPYLEKEHRRYRAMCDAADMRPRSTLTRLYRAVGRRFPHD